jgi:quercetin dioxygenase-like cupin family protein
MGCVKHIDWASIEIEQLTPLMSRQVVHTEEFTVARLELKQGAIVPEHRHKNEQFSIVESGALQFLVGGREIVVRGGHSLALASNEPHGVVSLEDSKVIDLFTPPREDWISGDDSYLRGGR